MDEKVGKLWDKFVTKKTSHLYKEEQILFSDKSKNSFPLMVIDDIIKQSKHHIIILDKL